VLPGANVQIHVVQHHPIAARHIHRSQFKKLAFFRRLRRVRSAFGHLTPHLLD
jgi:hypothetical protein